MRVGFILGARIDRERAIKCIEGAPVNSRVEIKAPARTLDQNALMWALLTEISEQLVWQNQFYVPEDWKDFLMHNLRAGRWMPSEDGGFVPIGMRTSDLTKDEMSDLVEVIYAFGARHGVGFSQAKDLPAESPAVEEMATHPESELFPEREHEPFADETPATAPERPQEPVQEIAATNAAQDAKGPFSAFWEELQAAPNWDTTKAVVRTLYNLDDFRTLTPDDKTLMRGQVWLEIEAKELRVDVAYDPTAFRLWLDTQEGREGADAIEGNFRVLKAGEPYQKMAPDNQDALEDVVASAIQRLKS